MKFIKWSLQHWMKKNIIFSLYPTHLCCMRSWHIKGAVSGVPDWIYDSWILWCSRILFNLRMLLNEGVWTCLRLSGETELLKVITISWFMGSGSVFSQRFLWSFSALCICLDIFVRNALIRCSLLQKWAHLHFHKGDVRRLPRMVVVEKVISLHELTFIELLVPKRQST